MLKQCPWKLSLLLYEILSAEHKNCYRDLPTALNLPSREVVEPPASIEPVEETLTFYIFGHVFLSLRMLSGESAVNYDEHNDADLTVKEEIKDVLGYNNII
mmetsp:Transcript_9845/g.28578  ORF Transcript_9845/g.28578 Transcript_9845/m.28578 type:complete len:101 (-) Transcript_9845:2-304(-)